MPSATTWMDLEIIKLSEVNQKDKQHIYHLHAEFKYDTNETIYRTETDSQTKKTNYGCY